MMFLCAWATCLQFVVVRYVFERYSLSFSHVIHELRNDAPAVMLVCVHVLHPLSGPGVLSNTNFRHSCCRVLLLLLLLFRTLVIRMCPVRCTSTGLVSKSCLIDALLEGRRTVSRVLPTITTTPWATELCFSPGDTSQPTPSRQKTLVRQCIARPLFVGHVGRRNASGNRCKPWSVSAFRLPPCAWPRENCMHTTSAAIGWSHLNWCHTRALSHWSPHVPGVHGPV